MIKQAVVPMIIVAIIATIVLPVPTYVMDFLLISNLVLALVLLVSTLYISDSLKLSSLPTILLLATLFRLALNISSTRLILSHGDAGKAIEAFGSLVIQDNIVVGAVVFLIITLVQFIVIAKGSERVAEVSARFTLDAMPGKQMSIDADVRAGLLDMEGAREKRQDLQTESRFYGSLDGAMKFIKGDAIAGIVICIVNLLGGFCIGMFMQDMELAEAVSKYSLLTIGDGLISQIPALLNALAAGLVVTRVTKGDGKALSTEMIAQLGQVRPVKIIIGLLCMIMAVVPGVPSFPLIVIAGLLFFSAAYTKENQGNQNKEQAGPGFQPRTPPVLQIRLSKEMAAILTNVTQLTEKVDQLRQNVFEDMGLIILRPDLAPLDQPGAVYKINTRGVTVYNGQIEVDKTKNLAEQANQVLDSVLENMKRVVMENSTEFVDDILTRRCLDYFDKEAPELVSAVVPNLVSVTQLTYVLKCLVTEGITIRNFDLIMQAVAETAGKGQGERFILEEVRIALKRVISQNYLNNQLKAVSIDPILDLALSKAEKQGQILDLEYITVISDSVKELDKDCAVVVSRASRKLLKDCLQARGLNLKVLAFEEIAPEVNVEWVGAVSAKDSFLEEKLVEDLAA